MEPEQRAHILQTGAAGGATLTQARSRALFNGQTEVGRTDHVVVYTDGTPQGDATAQAILQTAEADFSATQDWFGGISLPAGQEGDDQTVPRTATPVQVLMDAQAGGAYHFGCNATDIYVEPTPELANGFFVAELVEVFEAAINNGWDCGQTNGEGLSRVLAGERNANLGSLFVQTEQSWWANGHVDYVDDNSADDTNQDANGCATLFLYYLHTQLNYDWRTIVAAGAPTLGGTYQRLTGKDPATGFSDFVTLLSQLDTGGLLNVPASGNPFPLSASAASNAPQQPGAGQGEPVPAGGIPGYGPFDGGVVGGTGDGSGMGADQGAWQGVAVEQVEVYTIVPDASESAGAMDQTDQMDAPAYPGYSSEAPPEQPVQVLEEVVVAPWPPDGSGDAASGMPSPSDTPATSVPPVAVPSGEQGMPVAALDRTGPIEPRGLDAAPAAAPVKRRGEGVETMIAVLIVLIVLVLLGLVTVLFASGIL